MPRLSRPTLKPNASSACVTAFSSDLAWACAAPEAKASAAAAILQHLRGRLTIRLPCCPIFAVNGRVCRQESAAFCKLLQRFDVSANGFRDTARHSTDK